MSLQDWNTDWAITWDRIRIVKLYSFFFSLFCAETGIKLEEMISSRLLNWGAAAVCHSRLNSAKTAFNVSILKYNGQKLKYETSFHI